MTQAARGDRGAFDRYLVDLQSLPLLDAKQEIALAQEIEALTVERWRALLGYRPAFDVVEGVVHEALGRTTRALSPLRKLRAAQPAARTWTAEAKRAAALLREVDKDCAALKAADAAVHEHFADDRQARSYLERVDRARFDHDAAKGRFVAANLRLVIALARRYDRRLMSLDDLIQEGNFGLIRAVERFDHRRGFRFSTYASWWIRHNLNRALSDKARLVRVPVHALDGMSRVARAIDAARSATGALPSHEELAIATGIDPEKLAVLRANARVADPVSLDRSLGNDSEQTLHDVLAANDASDPDHALDLERWRHAIERMLRTLSPIEATTLRLRFGLDGNDELTLGDIGAKYNLSRERIRQIQEQALRKLRDVVARTRRPSDEHGLAA